MDRHISTSQANQRFSQMIRDVQDGDSFVVLSRGRPIARVVPIDHAKSQHAVTRLLDYVNALPVRDGRNWTRDDLYPG